MSKKKKAENSNWPTLPMWDPSDWEWEGWEDAQKKSKKKAGEVKAEFKAFWEKGIDLQKSSIDKSKDQYDQFFGSMQDTMDSIVEYFPEELPWTPPCFVSPKEFRKTMKEWEKLANEHIKEQADSLADFAIKSQEKACKQIPDAPEDAEETEVVAEVEAVEEKPAKETKPAATRAKSTTQAKKETKPAATRTTQAKSTTQAKDAKDAKATK